MVSAEGLQRLGQYTHAILFLQQAVEKTLKALLLKQSGTEPPRIHSLRNLAERCRLKVTAEQILLLENLNEYYLESRYPGDWVEELPEVMAEEVARLVPAAKELIECLRSMI